MGSVLTERRSFYAVRKSRHDEVPAVEPKRIHRRNCIYAGYQRELAQISIVIQFDKITVNASMVRHVDIVESPNFISRVRAFFQARKRIGDATFLIATYRRTIGGGVLLKGEKIRLQRIIRKAEFARETLQRSFVNELPSRRITAVPAAKSRISFYSADDRREAEKIAMRHGLVRIEDAATLCITNEEQMTKIHDSGLAFRSLSVDLK